MSTPPPNWPPPGPPPPGDPRAPRQYRPPPPPSDRGQQLRQNPQSGWNSPALQHGYDGDPRYPAPRKLRTVLAFVVDLALSLGGLVGSFLIARHVSAVANFPTVVAIVVMVIVSFVNRVLVQSACRASVGKAIFALRLVRRADGGRPGFPSLARAWLLSIGWIIAFAGDLATEGDPSAERFPAVVRRRDLLAPQRN